MLLNGVCFELMQYASWSQKDILNKHNLSIISTNWFYLIFVATGIKNYLLFSFDFFAILWIMVSPFNYFPHVSCGVKMRWLISWAIFWNWPEVDIEGLEGDIRAVLGGILDLRYPSHLSFRYHTLRVQYVPRVSRDFINGIVSDTFNCHLKICTAFYSHFSADVVPLFDLLENFVVLEFTQPK